MNTVLKYSGLLAFADVNPEVGIMYELASLEPAIAVMLVSVSGVHPKFQIAMFSSTYPLADAPVENLAA
jgi:hypothetical protein